jgi:hypothetical protein
VAGFFRARLKVKSCVINYYLISYHALTAAKPRLRVTSIAVLAYLAG